MPVLEPTNIKVRVEFVTQPKAKVTAENVSRRLLPWNEISHEVEVSLGSPNEGGEDVLGVELMGNAPARDWFWNSDVFPFTLTPDTEVLPNSGWVKITYTSTQGGQVHIDTACYAVDASTNLKPADVPDLEFVLRQTVGGVKLIFLAAGGPGAAPICEQLQNALTAVPPESIRAASYRMALIANLC